MDDTPVLPPCVLINENQAINTNDRKIIRDAGVEHIATLTNGYETAKKLAKNPDYHVILIVGERLADMTGEQFCDIIRLHPKLSAHPILLLVSQESTKLEMQTLGTRASAILVRPFSVESMRQALTDLAGKTKKIPPSTLKASETNFHAYLDNLETLLRPNRHGPEDFYKVGMKCLQQKKWDNAIRAFKEALTSSTVKGEAELGLAAAFTGKKSPRESTFWLAQAAETMVDAGRWNIARSIFSRIATANTRARNPFFLQARKQINQKEYAKAAKTLAEGLETAPAPLVSEKMAELCALAGDPRRMLGLLEKELDRHPTSDKTIRPDLRERFERKCQEAEERALLASLQRKEDLSRRLGLSPQKNEAQDEQGAAKAKERADEQNLDPWGLEDAKPTSQKTPSNYEALGLLALPGDAVDKKKPQNDTPAEPKFQSHSGLFGDIVQIIRMTYSLMRNS